MAFEVLLRPLVLGPLLALFVVIVWNLVFAPGQRVPDGLPIIGAKEGEWFPLIRARWRNSTDFKKAITDAYTQHRGSAVLFPLMESGAEGKIVLLPASEAQFIVDQPDTALDMHEMACQALQTDYTMPDPEILVTHPLHHKIISTTLTHQIGNLLPDLDDELAWAFGEHWGNDSDGLKEVCVYDTVRRIVSSAANRAFVGLPYCRNPKLLDAGVDFASAVPVSALFLRRVWGPVRPLAAALVTLPNWWHTRRFLKVLLPEVHARLAAREDEARGGDVEKPTTTASEPRRNDFLEWTIQQALEVRDPRMRTPRTIASRILLLNMASIHTSSFTFTDVVLDLAASGRTAKYLDEIRAEIASVLADENGRWTKRSLARMEKLDSCLRESARLHSFNTLGLRRLVIAPGGVTTPSGVHLPHGSVCALPTHALFTDVGIYGADAAEFDPFRFAAKRRAAAGDGEHVKGARNAFSATSTEFLAFGHGRHACPGRFFAAAELKLMLAYLVVHYDIEPLAQRPPDKWVGMVRIPAMEATIRVRRRKVAAA